MNSFDSIKILCVVACTLCCKRDLFQFSAMTYSVDSKSITLPVRIWISMEDIKGSR